MKRLILALTVTMLTIHLPAPTLTLTASVLSGGQLQIIGVGSGFSPVKGYKWVLSSTTDFITWTPIATNGFNAFMPIVTNIVQATNGTAFYRAAVY
jgi:hypothetical protein